MLLFIIAVRWVCRQSNHINANTTDNCYPNFLGSKRESWSFRLSPPDGTIEQPFNLLDIGSISCLHTVGPFNLVCIHFVERVIWGCLWRLQLSIACYNDELPTKFWGILKVSVFLLKSDPREMRPIEKEQY
jgi:hypothetical protein